VSIGLGRDDDCAHCITHGRWIYTLFFNALPSYPLISLHHTPLSQFTNVLGFLFRIPPPPSSPPPPPPMHPRASRLTFGVGTVFSEPRRQLASLTGATPPQNLQLPSSDPRRRSLSSPTVEMHRFRQSNAITPRPAIASSSWDDNKLPYKHYSLPPLVRATPAVSSGGASSSISATSTAASSQDYLPHFEDPSTRSGTHSTMPGNDGRTDGIPKPDFVSHFEAITQLNLKMESEELLTAEELGRALKYLFSRYHGVLDSVGEFKAQLDGENAELRAQIFSLRQQLLNNNAEVLRLKALLAEHGISGRRSSESTETVRGPSTASVRPPVSSSSSSSSSVRMPGSPGPPPTSSLPPLPPFDQKDAQWYASRVPLPIPHPTLYEHHTPSDGEPRAI
jgi:hypothetical protein